MFSKFFVCFLLCVSLNNECYCDTQIKEYIKEKLTHAQNSMELLSETNMLSDDCFFFLYGYETACLDFIEEIEAMEKDGD
jgi:hypothetical protein